MPLDASKPTLTSVGDYELIQKLAEGGMGTVYKGRHRQTGIIVAVKVIAQSTARNPVLLQRFEREFQAANALDHPNIVRAIEYSPGPVPYLVMEFVDGESLGQRIERVGRLPEDESVRLLAQVCQGLHRAHREGLIHRDVKPDNIMVTRDGVAKLTDLGLVKDMGEELNLTRTGRGLGTPHFMAPEQFRNAKNADIRCDIYSLGATLYMMVTGDMPFGRCGPLDAWMKKVNNDFPSPKSIFPGLSDRLDWAIRRSMSGDPDQRPANCREFVEDLIGTSTRVNANSGVVGTPTDIWYMVYKDEDGESHTVKGPTEGIRRAFREGLLGNADNIRASRGKAGPFQPLRSYPEFRDLVIAPAPLPPSTPKSTPTNRATPPPSGSARVSPKPAPAGDDAVDLGGALPAGRDASSRSLTRRGPTSSVSGRIGAGPPSSTASGKVPAASPSSSRLPTPDSASTNPAVSGRLPHIQLEANEENNGPNWVVMFFVLVLGLAAAAATYYFLQHRH